MIFIIRSKQLSIWQLVVVISIRRGNMLGECAFKTLIWLGQKLPLPLARCADPVAGGGLATAFVIDAAAKGASGGCAGCPAHGLLHEAGHAFGAPTLRAGHI